MNATDCDMHGTSVVGLDIVPGLERWHRECLPQPDPLA